VTQPATTHAAMSANNRKINIVGFMISLRVYPVD
jgi:hypothetical protein